MTLYRPTPIDIDHTMRAMRAANPHLGAYADRAEQILHNHDLFWRSGWRVWSQADATNGASYSVGRAGCQCHSYQAGCAPTLRGRVFCKHMIAVHAYVRILRNHLRDRWIGSDGNAPNIRLLTDYPYTYLAISPTTGAIRCGFGPRMVLDVRTAPARDGEPTFATARDGYLFARWLYNAEPVPETRPDRPPLSPPPPSGQWSPQWTIDQYHEWLETGRLPGEVPAWMKDQF